MNNVIRKFLWKKIIDLSSDRLPSDRPDVVTHLLIHGKTQSTPKFQVSSFKWTLKNGFFGIWV